MPRSLQSRVVPLLKVVFAAAVIAWMARTGKLDFSQVAKAWADWPALLAVIALLYSLLAVASWRWRYLLVAQDVPLPYGQAFSLTMIGALFNIAIPGAVGGDVMKAYYVNRQAGSRGPQALTTILMDRVVGVVALALLAAFAAVWKLQQSSGGVRQLCYLAILLASGGVAALIVAVQAAARIRLRPDRGRFASLAEKLLDTFRPYHRSPHVLPVGIAVSLFGHCLTCYGIYLCASALSAASLPLRDFVLLVPLGLMTTAIPISPAGIGVGQAAFFALFGMVPGASPAMGANTFTVYQSVMIAVNLTGFIPYLAYKDRALHSNA